MKFKNFSTGVMPLTVMVALLIPNLAYSQEEPVADADEDADEVIMVTGSAIERIELTTPAPIAVLDREDLEAAGMANVGDILQNLPSQSNAINIQANNGGNGATRVNLRGLGTGRTLVLVNGRRHVGGGDGADASVDLNAIPIAVIERVEVLKDGASAVYGADAIGGVVNIITRKDMDTTEAAIYLGTAQDGAGTVVDMSVTTGTRGDKGGAIFSAGYFSTAPIYAGQRDFSASDKSYDWETGDVTTAGSSAPPQGAIIDWTGAPGNAAWQDMVANNPSGFYYNDPSDGWRDFNDGGNSDVGEGDFYNYQPENYNITPGKRFNLYSAGDYEFSDAVSLFYEASYLNRRSDQLLAPTPLFIISEGLSVSADNYYNPFGRDFIDVRRRFVEASNRRFFQNIDTVRVVVGLDGKIPQLGARNWRWNVAYNFGRTQGINVNEGRFVRSRVEQALGPSYVDADGNPRCGTASSPGDADCVPLNLFGGEGTITQDMLDYITYTGTAFGFTQQQSATANLSGKIVDTPWDGALLFALGAEYRDEQGGFEPDPITASGDTTGNKGEATLGGYNVGEGYGELLFIPVSGHKIFRYVEINGAARYSQYSNFGSNLAYKAGALVRVPAGIAVRGTLSTAFRAPSVAALFFGQSDSFPAVTDPCDVSQGERSPTVDANCQADGIPDDWTDARTQLRSRVGGNPDLQPETANLFTAGLVYEPTFVDGLSFTVDYFSIKIEDSIQTAGASVILSNCYAQEERSNCDLIIRDANGAITDILDTVTNIGGAKTAGLDFAAAYDLETGSAGRYRISAEGTWLQTYTNTQADGRVIEGKGVYDLGVHPPIKTNFALLWGLKGVAAGVNVRYIAGYMECEDNDCSVEDGGEQNLSRDVDANVTADLFVGYTLESKAGQSSLRVGMNNVTNQAPPLIYNGFQATSDASNYDYLGRYMYARLSHRF